MSIYTSSLLFFIAPPLSCTTNHPPFGLFAKYGIYITVPTGYAEPAATVYQADALAPDDVIPYPGDDGDFPHVDAVYADVFSVLTCGSIPSTTFAKFFAFCAVTPLTLYVFELLVDTSSVSFSISFTGCDTISLLISTFSISISFLYFALYTVCFFPAFPFFCTL